jgi:hypothetical protein
MKSVKAPETNGCALCPIIEKHYRLRSGSKPWQLNLKDHFHDNPFFSKIKNFI